MKLEGMDDLLKQFETLGQKSKSVKKKAIMEGAEPIRKQIADNAPRSAENKSHAADHIVIEYDEKEEMAYIGGDKKAGWYLRFPEWGTSRQPAQGFTEKAFHDSKNEAQRKIAQALKKELGL